MPVPLDAQDLTDSQLLQLYAQGHGEAARLLTGRLLPRVLAHAARMLGDRADAEDVAQEAMLRLWQAAPGWQQGGAQPGTWLYKVTANLCIDRLRRSGRAAALDAVPEPEDPAPGAESRLQQGARADALQQALMELPPRQRQAVVLRHIEGLGNPQIAAIMEITPEAVESLTARGKRTLAAQLRGRREELGFEDD